MTKAGDQWALDKYLAAVKLHFDARSLGQSISRSVVWRILLEQSRFHLDRGGVKIPLSCPCVS